MILAFAALAITNQQPAGIGEFFPLNVGDEWHYVEEGQALSGRTVDTVGEVVEIEGKMVFPVITSREDKEIDRVYYWVGQGTVDIIAFDKEKPLLSAYSILKDPKVTSKWSYQGETYMQGAPADLKMEGRAKSAGTVEFDGKKVDAIEVRLEATILEEFGTKITITQVATYGRGIGLIKMENASKLPKHTVKTSRRLTAYKPKRT